MKKIHLLLLFVFIVQVSFGQGVSRFNKATFTVLPFVSYVNDTLLSDTRTVSWKKLSDESILNLKIDRNLVNTDLFVSKKYFYTHTDVKTIGSVDEDLKDFELKRALYSLFEFKENKSQNNSRLESLARFGSREFYIDSADVYSKWIQQKLENSSVPGEMMFLWTNRDILKSRAKASLSIRDSSATILDEFNMEYYQSLLDKNYIVVLHTVHTEKYNFTSPKKIGTKLAEKLKRDRDEGENVRKNALAKLNLFSNSSDAINKKLPDPIVSDKAKEKDKSKFVKAYLYRVLLDQKIENPLSKTPREIPQNANLEFVAKIVINEPNLESKREADLYTKAESGFGVFTDYEKEREEEFYAEIENQANLLIKQGEYKCAQEALNSLLKIKGYSKKTYANELLATCETQQEASPIYNEIKWGRAENIQKQNKELFKYQEACNVPDFSEFKNEQTNTQGGINAVLDVLEKNNQDFMIASTVNRKEKNIYTSQMTSGSALYLDQQFSAISFRKKDDKVIQKKLGTLKIVKVGVPNVSLTELALVDGSNLGENTVIVESNDAGSSILAGYGYKYNDNAVTIGFEGRPSKIFKSRMPMAGIRLGINYTINTTQHIRWSSFETYLPSFLDLNLSREFYLTKVFDIKPYTSLGYGGEWKKDSEYSYFVPTIGLALPINITGKYLKTKIKLMPDMSLALNWRPQIGLLTKIDF